jgi:hypothetical protein
VKALRAHDPSLRCRWARASRQWFIEERMPARHPDFVAELAPPDDDPVKFDRWESLQAGYYPRFTIPREAICQTERVMAGLRQFDAATAGSFKAINRRLDAEQDAWDAARRKRNADFVDDRAGDAWDLIQWRAGHRLTTSDMTEGAETSDAVEQREGYTVRVRKGQHAEATS